MLTQLETKILEAIRHHINQHDIAPTIAEIAQQMGINSRGTVHRYIQSLIKKGELTRVGTGWRGLRIASDSTVNAAGRVSANPTPNPAGGVPVQQSQMSNKQTHPAADQNQQTVPGNVSVIAVQLDATDARALQEAKIPLLGKIAAGVPIEAIPDEHHLDLSVFLVGTERYALRVSGDSMIDAGILDGDTVILRKTSVAKVGDIVVALIDNQEATLKRLGKTQDGLTELIPENKDMPTMLYSSKRLSIQGVLVGQFRSY